MPRARRHSTDVRCRQNKISDFVWEVPQSETSAHPAKSGFGKTGSRDGKLPEIRRKEVKMKKAIMATKIGMTQIFREDGTLIPVTVLEAGPCVVTQVKTMENDGYEAVQVGFGEAKERITTVDKSGKKEVAHRHGVGKAMKGHFEKAGVPVKKHVQEFKLENAAEYKLGDEIKADIFAEGDKIDATAVTKGKGFQGAIKRFGQHRGPMGHGSKFHRHQGSNGSSSDPSRVFKGKGMPGHMGSVQVTIQNLEVVKVDADKNLILVKGAIPGPKKGLVTLKETTRV